MGLNYEPTLGNARRARVRGRPRSRTARVAPPNRRFRPSYGAVAAINQSVVVFPVLVTVWLFIDYSSAHLIAVDFHHDFWVAGYRVLHGLSPYGWTRAQIAGGVCFPYPAPAALAFVPLSLLPRGLADLTFVGLSIAACLSALRILNVRDFRLYTLVLLWWPVISGWQTANVTLLFVCGVAAVWRYRDSPIVAGVLTALMLCVKPVVWPLVLWLLITRRGRAAAYGLVLALAVNVISWAALGFGQLSVWWHQLGVQVDVLYRQGYGLVALVVRLGAGRTAGTVVQIVAAGALTILCVRFAWRRRERAAFTLAIGLMLVSSPLVDNHYFALLIVPLAIARPYLSRAWLPPLALWLCPATGFAGWQLAVAWVTFAAMMAWLILEDQAPSEARTARVGYRAFPRCRSTWLSH
jgi:Glycosyltransferase family 87